MKSSRKEFNMYEIENHFLTEIIFFPLRSMSVQPFCVPPPIWCLLAPLQRGFQTEEGHLACLSPLANAKLQNVFVQIAKIFVQISKLLFLNCKSICSNWTYSSVQIVNKKWFFNLRRGQGCRDGDVIGPLPKSKSAVVFVQIDK